MKKLIIRAMLHLNLLAFKLCMGRANAYIGNVEEFRYWAKNGLKLLEQRTELYILLNRN